MTLLNTLQNHREEILRIANECGLKDVRVFGSVARGEEDADSDIDLLVSYDEKSQKGWEVFGFSKEIENLVGRKVDLVFESGLYHVFRDEVLREARPL